MSANTFNLKCESTELPSAATSELYTYYPTWFNGKPTTTVTTTTTTLPKSFSSLGEQEALCQQQLQQYSVQQQDIVISGVSGKFPESDNVEEFAKNLYSGVDMVTEDERRWPSGLYGLPTRTGTIKDISRFDAQFFGIHPKQVS